MNPHCCAQTCAFYSATGIVFTGWVGVMLVKQPFFIGGINDVDTAKGSAFGAAGMFLFFFVASIMYLVRSGGRQLQPATASTSSSGATRNLGRLGASEQDYGQVPSSERGFT